METYAEVRRLKAVYQAYAQRKLGASKWSPTNWGNQAILQERDRTLLKQLGKSGFLPLDERRILDVGCGSGGLIARFQTWGARAENLFGVDLLAERIHMAKERFPGLSFQQVNAEALTFENEAFDLVALFTVLSSILSTEMTRNLVQEVKRVLRPGGAIAWYDFRMNNPLNPHVRGISRRRLAALFPGFEVRVERATLLPQLARRLGVLAPWLYPVLGSFHVLRTHYVGLLLKP
jgi:ubiquinone/menaquinone biosynthesis C-methylase UbiE